MDERAKVEGFPFRDGTLIFCRTGWEEAQYVAGAFKAGRLLGPRVFSEDRIAKTITLAPLPGTPEAINILPSWFCYPVSERDRSLIELYAKVTSPAAYGTGGRIQ
jgi:hypothetical protein